MPVHVKRILIILALKPSWSILRDTFHLPQTTIWASMREKLPSRFANNKGAHQPVYLRILISAFVICIWESIIYKLSTGEISIF